MNTEGSEKIPLTITQQFMDYFNQVEQHMRHVLNVPPGNPLKNQIRPYYKERPWVPGESELSSFVDLRNAVIHTTTDPRCPLFEASEEAVRLIKDIAENMLMPLLVQPLFKRPVEKVSSVSSLFSVLNLIRDRDFSQFPVYDDKVFHGLLTETGITRWLSRNATEKNITLMDVSVKDLLRQEEEICKHEFIPMSAPVDQLLYLYSVNPYLEAVLITQDGKESHDLIGIATRYDVLKLSSPRPKNH